MPANKVRQLRERKEGLSRAEFARLAKIDPATLARVEDGGNCRIKTARKIVTAFGLHWESQTGEVFPNGWEIRD